MGKRVAITIHGIRTRGEWQKKLAPVLAQNDIIPYPLDFGWFSTLAFLLKCQRKRKLKWFHEEYDQICRQERVARPSVIAHSFGTYLVAQLLEQYSEIKFDKVIFAGSIANESFDWADVIEKNRVLFVRNEIAKQDIWPKVAKCVIEGTGNSGSSGFTCTPHPYLSQEEHEIDHSGAFFHSRFNEWIQYLKRPLLSQSDQRRIKDSLEVVVRGTLRKMGIPKGSVRANIFVPVGDELVIPEGAHHNMDGHPDLSIRIRIGMGSTGRSFEYRTKHVAIFKDHWGDDTLPDNELEKVHSDLKWIISIPLCDPDDGRTFGVMNVDGLCHSRTIEELTTGAGEELLNDLHLQTVQIAKTLCNLEQGRI